ncbi:uncharacterized protein LOC106131756 isoform X2 [Amyelois transitella]|uniref:uncharacterized protein LOC106131756 isoform X2 n=1 Tax=Amyelois transitella TaxID=680683 RepID=UPI00298FF62A|nr:uncharacterized protein LOC106131756 isoform X2 [Amyelois transitella]
MAHRHDKNNWDDEDWCHSSGRDSDDSPIISYRYEKSRRCPRYVSDNRPEERERERRSTVTILAKYFLFCTAMIMFCVLMYIPVYNRANTQLPKVLVAGWSIDSNRDTRIYVQPNNVTIIHEPNDVCPKSTRDKKNNLFLLIIVCSSTTNFEERQAIRETWGHYQTYMKISRIYHTVRERYKNYNYTYDLYPMNGSNISENASRSKRDITSFSRLLPELAKALQSDVKTEEVPEKRFDDDDETNAMLPEFDMNKELNEQTDDYELDYESNIMSIPPKGYSDSQDVHRLIKLIKFNMARVKSDVVSENVVPDYKVVFLLGMPSNDNDSRIQNKIEEEVEKYRDVIQEGFVDSYNNLTLKSIMMLKWIKNSCNESVRYILKTDDDMYINVPNLVMNLRNRSEEFDEKVAKGYKGKEYLLIGDLIHGAKPVLDSHNKWYSPRYMFGGRVYPRYVSGTGYVLSAPAAHALYEAALTTHFFHLEDIFITGMCSSRSRPRVVPRDDPAFSYAARAARCVWRATAHKVPPAHMYALTADMLLDGRQDACERKRLTEIRRERLKAKRW